MARFPSDVSNRSEIDDAWDALLESEEPSDADAASAAAKAPAVPGVVAPPPPAITSAPDPAPAVKSRAPAVAPPPGTRASAPAIAPPPATRETPSGPTPPSAAPEASDTGPAVAPPPATGPRATDAPRPRAKQSTTIGLAPPPAPAETPEPEVRVGTRTPPYTKGPLVSAPDGAATGKGGNPTDAVPPPPEADNRRTARFIPRPPPTGRGGLPPQKLELNNPQTQIGIPPPPMFFPRANSAELPLENDVAAPDPTEATQGPPGASRSADVAATSAEDDLSTIGAPEPSSSASAKIDLSALDAPAPPASAALDPSPGDASGPAASASASAPAKLDLSTSDGSAPPASDSSTAAIDLAALGVPDPSADESASAKIDLASLELPDPPADASGSAEFDLASLDAPDPPADASGSAEFDLASLDAPDPPDDASGSDRKADDEEPPTESGLLRAPYMGASDDDIVDIDLDTSTDAAPVDEPSPRSPRPAPASEPDQSSSSARSRPRQAAFASTLPSDERRPTTLWLGAAAVVLVVVALVWLLPGDEREPEATVAAGVDEQARPVDNATRMTAPAAESSPSLAPDPGSVDKPPDEDSIPAADDGAGSTGLPSAAGDTAPTGDTTSASDAAPAVDTTPAADTAPTTDSAPDSGPPPSEVDPAPPAEPPAAAETPLPSASGDPETDRTRYEPPRAREDPAYRQAAQEYQDTGSMTALLAMTKAACTVGDGPTARNTFRKLKGKKPRSEAIIACRSDKIDITASVAGYTGPELLKQANKALTAGDPATALTIAQASNKVDRSSEALRVMMLATCRLGQAGRAAKLFKHTARKHRKELRAECETAGITLR